MSPVRIIELAAEIWGRRFLAKIMKAFMGRFGVPSALRVWDVSARWGSSARTSGASVRQRTGARASERGRGQRG